MIPLWLAQEETARCTGHCCDPVQLGHSPGDLRRLHLYPEDQVLPDILIYQGWRPPSRGGWTLDGNHEYHCRHFDRATRSCAIHHEPRPRMCTGYPEYKTGRQCEHPECTRRTRPGPEAHLRILKGID